MDGAGDDGDPAAGDGGDEGASADDTGTDDSSRCAPKTLTLDDGDHVSDWSLLEGVTIIEGEIDASYTTLEELLNLSCLEEIDGLHLQSDEIVNLDFLSQLRHVHGKLEVRYCENLRDWRGLGNLESVGGTLSISDHSHPIDGEAFSALERVEGGLMLEQRSADRLSWSSALREVGGGVTIWSDRIGFESSFEIAGFSGLETVGGSLSLHAGSRFDDAFRALRSLGGSLSIGEDGPESIVGFPSLVTIGGALEVERSSRTRHISGFAALESVPKIVVTDNEQLEVLGPFPTLTELGILHAHENPKLRELGGFPELEQPLEIELMENPSLALLGDAPKLRELRWLLIHGSAFSSFDVFNGVETIQGPFEFIGDTELKSLDGFRNLKTVGRNLFLEHFAALEAMPGFQNLERVEGEWLYIQDNLKLRDVSHLHGVHMVLDDDFDEIRIAGNPQLQACDAEALGEALEKNGFDGPILVSENLGECE